MDKGSFGSADGRQLVPIEPPDGVPLVAGDKHQLFMQTLNRAQVDFLLQRTPREEIKLRQGRGGMKFSYVEHGYVTERLNLVFGFNWDFEIVDKQILEDEVVVEARLTVRTPGGQTIVKTQFGGADIKRHSSGPKSGRPLSIADDFKAAGSDALKKCASLLGIGLDLYGRDRPDEADDTPHQMVSAAQTTARQGSVQPQEDKAISHIGGQNPGLCKAAQLKEIGQLVSQASMSASELCHALGVVELSELTEARAQRVIGRLRQIAQGQEQAS